MKFLILIPLILLSSCGGSKKKDQANEKQKLVRPERQIVGRIASVSQVGQFVLIQKFGAGSLPKDLLYQSQGSAGRSASLNPSGERVRDFYAADLVSGTVEKGDAVIGYLDLEKITKNDDETSKTEGEIEKISDSE